MIRRTRACLALALAAAVVACGGNTDDAASNAAASAAGPSLRIERTAQPAPDHDGLTSLRLVDASGRSPDATDDLLVQLSLDPDFTAPVDVDVAAKADRTVGFVMQRPMALGAESDDAPVYVRVRRDGDGAVSNSLPMTLESKSAGGLPPLLAAIVERLRNLVDLRTYVWTRIVERAEWQPRAGLQAVELGERLYVMGGRTPLPSPIPGASILWGDVWRSDDGGSTWHAVRAQGDPQGWPARAYFQAVTKGPRMFVLGGQDFRIVANPGCAQFPPGVPCPLPDVPASTFFNDVWSSTDGGTWSRLTADAGWAGRAGLSAAVFRNAIYVMGGSQNDDTAIVGGPPTRIYFNDVWRSVDGVSWERVTAHAPWAPRAGAVAAVKDGYLWILGGEDGFLCDPQRPDRCPPYYNDVWRSRDGRHWEQVTAAAGWSPRPGHQCVVQLNRFVCFGGFGLPENPKDVWASPNGRDWAQVDDAPWNAQDPSEVKYDFDALVVAGGRLGLRPTIMTFGGDRETFDFADPENFKRVDNDVWRFGPR